MNGRRRILSITLAVAFVAAGLLIWRAVAAPPYYHDSHGWVATGGYPMLWTADGGRHWLVMKLPGDGSNAVAVAPGG